MVRNPSLLMAGTAVLSLCPVSPVVAQPTQAEQIAELQQQVAALQSQLAELRSQVAPTQSLVLTVVPLDADGAGATAGTNNGVPDGNGQTGSCGQPQFACDLAAKSEDRKTGGLNHLSKILGLSTFESHEKGAAPIFSLATNKDGDYSGFGLTLRSRRYVPETDEQYHAMVTSVTPTLYAKLSDGKATLRSYDTTTGNWGWGSDIAVSLDLRRSWGRSYDKRPAKAALEKALGELVAACEKAGGAKCRDEASLTAWSTSNEGRDAASKVYWNNVAQFWGLDSEGKDYSVSKFVGITGRWRRNETTFFPLSDPGGLGVDLLPALPSDLSSDSAKNRVLNDLSFKAYGGMTLLSWDGFRPVKDEDRGTPKADASTWDLGLAISAGWRRTYRYPKDTEGQTLCYEDAQLVGFSRCKKVNIAAPYRSEGATLGVGTYLRAEKIPLLGRPWISLNYVRDFDLKQDTFTLPVIFAFNGSDLSGGVQFVRTGTGTTSYGEEIPGNRTITIVLEKKFDWPLVP